MGWSAGHVGAVGAVPAAGAGVPGSGPVGRHSWPAAEFYDAGSLGGMRRARYRLGQFFSHLWPRPLAPHEQAEVQRVLGAPLAALFGRMSAGEQAHSLRVLHTLAERGGPYAQRLELRQAALLHDV